MNKLIIIALSVVALALAAGWLMANPVEAVNWNSAAPNHLAVNWNS